MAKPKRAASGAEAQMYDVGYGKPPRASQFRKGQSGNRKGRPKGSKNLATELAQALNERVTVVENGRRRAMTKREAICRQLTNRSAAGDMAAMRLLLSLIAQVEATPANDEFRLDPAQDRALAQALFARLRNLGGESAEEETK